MPGMLVPMLKLYVPLALIAGLVVALPTLAAQSVAGRSVGVVCGVAVIALFAWGVTQLVRRPTSIGERHSLTLENDTVRMTESGDDGVVAARMMRRFQRLHWLARWWPVMVTAGLVSGGLLGVWAGSFVLTLLFAAAGFLITSLAPFGYALRGMRQLSSGSPP